MSALEVVAYLSFGSGAIVGAVTVGAAYWANNGLRIIRARRRVPASRKAAM